MDSWSQYFFFPAGTSFFVDGPWGYNGRGRVDTRTDTVLQIRLDIDSWGPAPALHASIRVGYSQEGPGNQVIIEHDDGRKTTDANATVRSTAGIRERAITSKDITCSIRYENDNEVDFDVIINGSAWDFDLIRE